MSDTNTNTGNLNPLFHPAAHYASPEDVLNDKELSAPEKRIILSSWASDMFAVESCPRFARFPAWATQSGSPTSSRRCGGSTATTSRRPAGACRCGCGGPGPPPCGGPHDAHAGCRDDGSAGACFGDVGRSVHCFYERVGRPARAASVGDTLALFARPTRVASLGSNHSGVRGGRRCFARFQPSAHCDYAGRPRRSVIDRESRVSPPRTRLGNLATSLPFCGAVSVRSVEALRAPRTPDPAAQWKRRKRSFLMISRRSSTYSSTTRRASSTREALDSHGSSRLSWSSCGCFTSGRSNISWSRPLR